MASTMTANPMYMILLFMICFDLCFLMKFALNVPCVFLQSQRNAFIEINNFIAENQVVFRLKQFTF